LSYFYLFPLATDIFSHFVLCILVIEHLPQELRDRFTEMREMDLGVQSKNFSALLFITEK